MSKPLDLLAAVVAAPQLHAKNDLSINSIPQQFQRRGLWRSRFSIKHSGLISAVRTGILGYGDATLRIATTEHQLAWAAMAAFRGIAEDGHGIVAHFRSFMLHAAFI